MGVNAELGLCASSFLFVISYLYLFFRLIQRVVVRKQSGVAWSLLPLKGICLVFFFTLLQKSDSFFSLLWITLGVTLAFVGFGVWISLLGRKKYG